MKSNAPSPWQVYQQIYAAHAVSFFLDSITYRKPNQRYSLIGWDPEDEMILYEKDLNVAGLQRLRKFVEKKGFVFGYLGYESAALFDTVSFRTKKSLGYPVIYLGRFKNLCRYDHKLGRWSGKAYSVQRTAYSESEKFKIWNFKAETAKKDFLKKVVRAKKYIEEGDIYQANLSQKFLFKYQGSPLAIYERLRSINPSPFSSYMKIRGLEVASSSPERLVQKRGQLCETRPIAGTCPKSVNEKTLNAWRKKLLGSNKERAEHLMLVDLERNDLGRVCDYSSVKVAEFMTLEKYSHVVHLVSSVVGKLRKDKDGLNLLAAMFPGGTITGCPKIRCMEIINELEPSQRGLYTGSIGYIAPNGDMDWNIVIRTLVFNEGQGSFQVGAGIVHDSIPEKEYLETLAKGEAMMQALAESDSGGLSPNGD